MTDSDAPAIPAATLILFRDRPGAPAELLFVERPGTMAFAPGALVFPGGRVDPGDVALAAAHAGDPADLAARIAAIRETIEETGIAAGLTPTPDERQTGEIRAALLAGGAIGPVLAAHGLAIDPAALVPFARWRPTHRPTRIFDTRFYLARAPRGGVAGTDGGETVRVFWASAAAVLADADAGRAAIIFPTRRTLERLARLSDFAAAEADARAYPPRLIAPWIERREGIDHLCIPEDAGYPVTSQQLAGVERG